MSGAGAASQGAGRGHPGGAWFAAGLLALALASVALQVAIRAGTSLQWGPAGNDASFWGLAAAVLPQGHLASRPPFFPGLVSVLASTTGLGLPAAAAAVSAVAGALMGPVFGLAVAALAGHRAGLLAGLLVSLLSPLQAAALLAEATTLYVVVRGLCLLAAVQAARHGGMRRGVVLGLLLGLLCLTKEQGVVDVLLLGAVPLFARRPGRLRMAAAVAGGLFALLFPLVAVDLLSEGGSVLNKFANPLVDQVAWYRGRVIPPPLAIEDPQSPARIALQQAAEAPGFIGWRLVAGALAATAGRFADQAGPWLLAIPLALAAPWLGSGVGERWKRAALLLPLGDLLVPLVLPCMPRHTAIALLPVACGAAVAVGGTAGGRLRAVRAGLGAGLILVLVGGEQADFRGRDLPDVLQSGGRLWREREQVHALEPLLPPGARIWSGEPCLAFWLGSSRRVQVVPVAAEADWLVVHEGVLARCGTLDPVARARALQAQADGLLALPAAEEGVRTLMGGCLHTEPPGLLR